MTAVVAFAPRTAQRLSLAERVERLEQQQASGQGGNAVDLVNQIQALQSQVQQLQGQVEELKHQLDEAKQRSKDQYIDLDSRIGRLEGHAPGGAPPPPARPRARDDRQPPDIELGAARRQRAAAANARDVPERARPNVGELRDDERGDLDAPPARRRRGAPPADAAGEQPTYDAAFAALKDGRYAESARRFQAFLDQYPNSGLAGNAYYWLGESYYVTQNYKIALQSFQTLLQRYPDSQKAPDALLKVGYSQYELKAVGSSRSHVEPGRADLSGHDRRASRAGSPARAEDGNASLSASGSAPRHRAGADRPRRPRSAEERLRITEIFHSLQGEADAVGWPTVFVRLTGCPLRCVWCDTEYAFHGGEWRTIAEILATVAAYGARHVCVTGGEPLAQKRCIALLAQLCDAGYEVSLETSGAIDVAAVDARVRKVVDLKAPGSGEVARNLWSNLAHVGARDQVKIVIADRADYEWARARVAEHDLAVALPGAVLAGLRRSSRRASSPNGSSPTGCRCASRCSCTRRSGARRRAT